MEDTIEREHSLAVGALEDLIEIEHSPVEDLIEIEHSPVIVIEGDLIPEAAKIVMVDHEHLVTSQDVSDVAVKLAKR